MQSLGLVAIFIGLLASSVTAAARGDDSASSLLPLVINTWAGPFLAATDAAYQTLVQPNATALDAVAAGCAACERNRCDGTVGYGGSPDEACETTLDAMLMDGSTLDVGAVAGLRRIKSAMAVARAVLERTQHSLLVGDLATQFAVENGFAQEDLSTEASMAICRSWREHGCQPNFRKGGTPDPGTECGPYRPFLSGLTYSSLQEVAPQAPLSHDTISMIAIDAAGAMAAGTSTNGATHKIPGRVGDGPIAGSGAYVDSEVGGCGATGDGDIMMRFLPCYQAVESLRRGMTPQQAADDAVRRMLKKYPAVKSGVVVVNSKGEHAGAASGWTFPYAFRGGQMDATEVVTVQPINVETSVPENEL